MLVLYCTIVIDGGYVTRWFGSDEALASFDEEDEVKKTEGFFNPKLKELY